MKVEHGMDFKTFDDCEKFMKDACNPGRDKQMDGDKKEVTSGEGYCEEYFPEAEKKAKKQIDDEDAKKEEAIKEEKPEVVLGGPAPGPATGPAPAPAKAAAAPAQAPAAAGPAAGGAPSPGPMG